MQFCHVEGSLCGLKRMRIIVTNIATEADVANGTRGEVTEIVLDPREVLGEPDENGVTWLKYPPALVLFKPDMELQEVFEGLPKGILPISPIEVTFKIDADSCSHTIRRRQLAITPAYAFTDYKAQGQTIEYVVVDIAQPPSGFKLTPFNVYVALSRSR